MNNPFTVTKAVDFSDEDIIKYWVDVQDVDQKGGLVNLISPTSLMPKMFLGGKGSGKTHILRYCSYGSQRLRSQDGPLVQVTEDGYVGIYFRCDGLNTSRFQRKNQPEEIWETVFQYYFEIWVGQIVIDIVLDMMEGTDELQRSELEIVDDIIQLFDKDIDIENKSIRSLSDALRALQKDVDYQVNNCIYDNFKLQPAILFSRGTLFYKMPKIFCSKLPSLNGVLFLYLIDEYENLLEYQQIFINTLIRERSDEYRCSIRVGSRLYGFKTRETLSAGELIKDGSEVNDVVLDRKYENQRNQVYSQLAVNLVYGRISEYRPEIRDSEVTIKMHNLKAMFDDPYGEDDEFLSNSTKFVLNRYSGARPYFNKLRDRLTAGLKKGIAPGVTQGTDIDKIIEELAVKKYPLLEKVNIFLLYQAWYRGLDLVKESKRILADCSRTIEGSKKTVQRRKLDHYKEDMYFQLLRECEVPSRYTGFERIIKLSWGYPRSLLKLMNKIFEWSQFYQENPFEGIISVKAQRNGIHEASEWFLHAPDIRGTIGKDVEDSINRLATLLSYIRYSDKPSECSCRSFTCDIDSLSEKAREVINTASQHSLLREISEFSQRDRNRGMKTKKYMLNGMLSPIWDLSWSSGGSIQLNSNEMEAIFNKSHAEQFESVLKTRISRMTAPEFGKSASALKTMQKKQLDLGFDHD